VLVGPETADDAGVFLLDGRALIATADFITPVCDDPHRFGRVAAANALSDVYAMGGAPLFALNLCCFPDDVPDGVLAAILEGAAAALGEAGGALLGGHTVRDPELKFGLAVIGEAAPGRLLTNAGARAGDRLVLTKPLGTGVLINAFKIDKLDEAGLEPALREMERLNAAASRLALAHGAAAELPWSITGLGLSSVEPQRPPAIVGGPDGDRPLNRSVVDRVRATLRRAMDRDELPDIPLLCAEEVDRSCAPWGLLAEDKQATLIAGIEIGACLAPLTDSAVTRYELACQIQARLRKEAYVLHARRYLADGGPIHPRQQQVIDDLAAFARPYLSRLWARLHGRDVWQEPCDDVDDVRALLEGVARSVSLDHRQRIKAMLELQVAG